MTSGAGQVERPDEPHFSFTERVQVADALLEVYSGCESAEHDFYTVLLPNILPERYPESTQSGVTWIGARAKASIELSRAALEKNFRQFVTDGELSAEMACQCAAVLQVPLELEDAQVIHFRQRRTAQS